jgi:hypothetical protein
MNIADFTPFYIAETLHDKVHALLCQGALRAEGRDLLGDLEALMAILADEEDRADA